MSWNKSTCNWLFFFLPLNQQQCHYDLYLLSRYFTSLGSYGVLSDIANNLFLLPLFSNHVFCFCFLLTKSRIQDTQFIKWNALFLVVWYMFQNNRWDWKPKVTADFLQCILQYYMRYLQLSHPNPTCLRIL